MGRVLIYSINGYQNTISHMFGSDKYSYWAIKVLMIFLSLFESAQVVTDNFENILIIKAIFQ